MLQNMLYSLTTTCCNEFGLLFAIIVQLLDRVTVFSLFDLSAEAAWLHECQ